MGQERLSGLAVISINAELAQKLSYDDLINDFAARKCRCVHLYSLPQLLKNACSIVCVIYTSTYIYYILSVNIDHKIYFFDWFYWTMLHFQILCCFCLFYTVIDFANFVKCCDFCSVMCVVIISGGFLGGGVTTNNLLRAPKWRAAALCQTMTKRYQI